MPSDPLLPPDSDPTLQTPVSSSSSPLTSDVTQGTSTGLAPNVAAGLSAIFTLLGGIVFIVLEKKSQFVRLWAMQSIFFGATMMVVGVVASIIGSLLLKILSLLAILWWLAMLIVYLALGVVWLITIVKAFSGQFWEIPVLGKLAREQLAKLPSA